MNINDKADLMVNRAYDMYPQKSKPSDYLPEGSEPFPMYSFERAACIFWSSFCGVLFEKGLTEEQVEWLLRSKHMRWMFDSMDDQAMNDLCKTLITENMIDTAKREA